MVKSKVALMLLVSIVFSISMKASWYHYHDRDGVGYNLEDYYGYWFWGVDGKGRDLTGHEMLGGHTILKHVGKSFRELRNRCSEIDPVYRYENRFKTTFTTFNQAKWSIRKLLKANSDNIKKFMNSSKKSTLIRSRYLVNEQRKYKYANYHPSIWTPSSDFYYFYGKGINCNLRVFNQIVHHIDFDRSGHMRYSKIYKDQYTRLRHLEGVLRKNGTTWFVLTSYPYYEHSSYTQD